METLALRDGNIFPTPEILKTVLNESYPAFEEWNNVLATSDINPEWNYYKDGKAWLCKMMFKKKNMGWISVYDGFFRVAFYFTEKHLPAIDELDIPNEIKEDFCKAKPSGKLIPMFFTITGGEKLNDIQTVLRFKKSLK